MTSKGWTILRFYKNLNRNALTKFFIYVHNASKCSYRIKESVASVWKRDEYFQLVNKGIYVLPTISDGENTFFEMDMKQDACIIKL